MLQGGNRYLTMGNNRHVSDIGRLAHEIMDLELRQSWTC